MPDVMCVREKMRQSELSTPTLDSGPNTCQKKYLIVLWLSSTPLLKNPAASQFFKHFPAITSTVPLLHITSTVPPPVLAKGHCISVRFWPWMSIVSLTPRLFTGKKFSKSNLTLESLPFAYSF